MSGLPRLRPLSKGLASFLMPALATVHYCSNPLGTISADSCYSVFLRHMTILRIAGAPQVPKVVAELGPGSSLGVGFAALIAGAEKYYALDLIDFSDTSVNLAIFDKLVALFGCRASIPASGQHSRRYPDLDSYDFPAFLDVGTDAAFAARVSAIRRDILDKRGEFIEWAAPWTEAAILQPHSVDWIFSQSVLEHIDDLDTTYRALAQWLAPGGYMSHREFSNCVFVVYASRFGQALIDWRSG